MSSLRPCKHPTLAVKLKVPRSRSAIGRQGCSSPCLWTLSAQSKQTAMCGRMASATSTYYVYLPSWLTAPTQEGMARLSWPGRLRTEMAANPSANRAQRRATSLMMEMTESYYRQHNTATASWLPNSAIAEKPHDAFCANATAWLTP